METWVNTAIGLCATVAVVAVISGVLGWLAPHVVNAIGLLTSGTALVLAWSQGPGSPARWILLAGFVTWVVAALSDVVREDRR